MSPFQQLVDKILVVEDYAISHFQRETLKEVQRFASAILQLSELMYHFREAGGNVSGAGGVAERLGGISPNAVYLRLDWLGLDADDLRPDRLEDPMVLIDLSDTLRTQLSKLERLHKQATSQLVPVTRSAPPALNPSGSKQVAKKRNPR